MVLVIVNSYVRINRLNLNVKLKTKIQRKKVERLPQYCYEHRFVAEDLKIRGIKSIRRQLGS